MRREYNPKGKMYKLMNTACFLAVVAGAYALHRSNYLAFVIAAALAYISIVQMPGNRTDEKLMKQNNPLDKGIEYID